MAVIGAGIMGLSTAYHLAKRGNKDITVFEKGLAAQASTGLSVGGFRHQFSLPANIILARESIRVLKHFKEIFSFDIGFRQDGYLFLAQQEKTWTELLTGIQTQRRMGVHVDDLTPGEIKKRWPYINTGDIRGGTFGPSDGYADPYKTAMGYYSHSLKMGVSIKENTSVFKILVAKNRISGIETSEGVFSCSRVLLTAGAWTAGLARTAGIELPIKPYRRQVFLTKTFGLIPKPVPMVIDTDIHFYFRGEEPGLLIGKSDLAEPSSFKTHVDRNFLEKVIEDAVHRVPILCDAQILRGWAGLYAVTPDNNPIIGPLTAVNGLYCAAGFSGHGFQQGPAVGRFLAEYISENAASFDLNPFRYDRFSTGKENREKRVV